MMTLSLVFASDAPAVEVGRALQFLANGKRALLISDTSNAVSALENACQLLGQLYGEAAVECGEAYFYYGKALLELARMESGVLENVGDGGKLGPHDFNLLTNGHWFPGCPHSYSFYVPSYKYYSRSLLQDAWIRIIRLKSYQSSLHAIYPN